MDVDFDEIYKLYEEDITYKALVDNYCRASIKYAKNMNNDTSKELSESLNALSNYKKQLRHNNLLFMMKELSFTNNDLVEMFEKEIISSETLSKMVKYKLGGED